jgi:hypothetical protein
MKHMSRIAVLLWVSFLLTATCANADSILDYTLTAQGSSIPLASWQMPTDPVPSCPVSPCFGIGDFWAFNVDLTLNGGPPTSDTLIFFNTGADPIDLNDIAFLIPEFTGDQLFTGDESAPHMKTGSFQLTDDGTNGTNGAIFTLNVTAGVPEPSSLLLFGMGLLTLSLDHIRRRARL